MTFLARRSWMLLACLLIVRSAAAGPANPQPFTITQPDGTPFQARLVGDEWSNARQTLDGFTIVRNDASGFWHYAGLDAAGAVVETPLRAGIDAPAGLAPNVMPARPPGAPAVAQVVAPAPVLGARPLLVLLVQFSNQTAATTAAAWQSRFFGTTNSVKHHYAVSSYGNVSITAATESHGTASDGIVGWLTLATPHPNTAGSTGTANQQLTKDAILAADPYVNFAAYDTNNNGRIAPNELDIIVIAAGNEGAFFDACSPTVWGHKWQIFAVAAPVVDGKTVGADGYAQFGEMHCTNASPPGAQATIGIMAHELGHLYGLPDLYDTDGSSEGVGEWSLMAGGSWNGLSRSGDSPSLHDPWSKAMLAWITPTAVTGSLVNQPIQAAATSSTVYQFRTGTPGVSGEYFLIENRQRTSYDAALKGTGLVIWHIDEARPGNTQECIPGGTPACTGTVHYKVAAIQADSLYHLERGLNRSDAGDPFPGTSGNRSFTNSSSPSSRLWSGASSGLTMTGISDSAATMTVTFSGGGTPFTDPTLTSGATIIKIVHVVELRNRINTIRAARGLGAYVWTDASLTAGLTPIRAAHITELRTALTQAYAAAALPPPTFTDTSLAGVAVKGVHIQQLRDAVTMLE